MQDALKASSKNQGPQTPDDQNSFKKLPFFASFLGLLLSEWIQDQVKTGEREVNFCYPFCAGLSVGAKAVSSGKEEEASWLAVQVKVSAEDGIGGEDVFVRNHSQTEGVSFSVCRLLIINGLDVHQIVVIYLFET